MAKHNKKKKKTTVTIEDFVTACRCGEFEANKELTGRLRSATYKSKKAYNRKPKHKVEY